MKLQQIESWTAKNNKQSKFDKLLFWLDKDRESAGQKYEDIRLRLIKIFYARSCYIAEELADETIDRVTNKIDFLTQNYVGNPALYFYGVAKKVFLEFTRKPHMTELPTTLVKKEEKQTDISEKKERHLTKCLEELSPEQSMFIIEYYKKDKSEKIKHRIQIAQKLGITNQALRVRAFRIRKCLQKSFSEFEK